METKILYFRYKTAVKRIRFGEIGQPLTEQNAESLSIAKLPARQCSEAFAKENDFRRSMSPSLLKFISNIVRYIYYKKCRVPFGTSRALSTHPTKGKTEANNTNLIKAYSKK